MDNLIDRFRANLVVNGQEPFSEDEWKMIKIGDLTFKVRCHFTFLIVKFIVVSLLKPVTI